MQIFKHRLHKLATKKWTFDNLTVVLLAILSIGLTGHTMLTEEPNLQKEVHAQNNDYNKHTDKDTIDTEELAVTLGATYTEDEGDLENSILTLSSNTKGEESVEQELDEQDEAEQVSVEQESTMDKINSTSLNQAQLDFIHKVVPVAVEVAQEYKLYPSIIVAQSILESDWGQSSLAVNANNLFGIKGSYNGNYHMHETHEDDGTGHQYKIIDKFAKYPSYKESIESNAQLIREGLTWDKNFYSGAWVENTSNYQEATQFLTGTYATDIYYNQKVNKVIQDYQLDQLD